jgi:hypothetical protein
VINSRVEVDFLEAVDMLDVGEELLAKSSVRKENSNRDALTETIYFLREEIEKLIDRQIDEVISEEEL